jgi:hypothetical protein
MKIRMMTSIMVKVEKMKMRIMAKAIGENEF